VMLGAVVLLMPNGIIATLRRLWVRRRAPAASIRDVAGAVGA